ncbi:MAG: cellulase family glycosylhydrolase [Mycobacterium sp.]|nr:cellulase family glycosylhydrolase [Mycobacterium sp.]
MARNVAITDVASIRALPSTLGFADSQIYLATQADTVQAVQKWSANGVNTVRIGIPWAGVEAKQNTFDWSSADRVVNAAAAKGMAIICVITSAPRWAMASGSLPPHGSPKSPDQYGDFTAKVAQRYKGKIAAYEIWNEPNGVLGYSPSPNPTGYTALLKAAYPKIKAVDPAAIVVAGALASGMSWGFMTINPVTFVTNMYAAGVRNYFDALSFHPYNYDYKFSEGMYQVDSPVDQLIRIRNIMVSNGDGAKKIWATEYGLPTNRVTEQKQAAFISDMIASWRQLPYVGPLMIYSTRDRQSGGSSNEDTFGVYKTDWTPKAAQQVIASPPSPDPVFNRFAKFTHPDLGEVLSPVFHPTPTMWAQVRTASMIWETAAGQSVYSPGPVGVLARARKVTPASLFANGYQDFTGTTPIRIWYSPNTGAHWASKGLYSAWVPQLGLATSDETWALGGTKVEFEHGRITWVPFKGAKVTLS